MNFVNLDAEMSVLGTMIKNEECIDDIQLKLTKEVFYKKEHQQIYNTLIRMYKERKTIDLITITEECKNYIDRVGGITYLPELIKYSNVKKIEGYINIVLSNYKKREMFELSKKIQEELRLGNVEVASTLFVEGANTSIVNEDINNGSVTEACDNMLNSVIEAKKNGGGIQGMLRGISSLDDRTNGKNRGNLDIIGGRPAMGKTTYLLNEIYGLISNGYNVSFFSLEMSKEEILLKLACRITCLNSEKIQRGEFTDEEEQAFIEAIGQIMNWNASGKFKLYARKNRETDGTIEDIISKIKADDKALRKVNKTLDVVYVDHISIIGTRRSFESERLKTKYVSNNAKATASELDINITLLSQLSRACEQRADHRPILSDLRESGDVEQDADTVMFLYRDEYYNKETEEKNIIECICAKVRMGKVGTSKLGWKPESSLVLDLDWREN